MDQEYINIINSLKLEDLYQVQQKRQGIHPTGFIVLTEEPISLFPFTLCPLLISKDLTGSHNPHDVIVKYTSKLGSLEKLLYTLWEYYKESAAESTGFSWKVYKYTNTLPPKKIIIPCLKRKENLEPVLKRLAMIQPPREGYKPQILLIEHSPNPEMQQIADQYNCEWIWFQLDHRNPLMPTGQFNKALCYDKAFIYGYPATWYLFHDNDILVPMDFWEKLEANQERTNAKFIQPYTHRSLLNLLPSVAECFRENLSLVDEPITPDMYSPISKGAPGGSLYIHRDRYSDVGGHDPNFCWGYGPEDAFFLHKLAQFEEIAYADEPPIEMIHLWHPPAAVTNPYYRIMDTVIKGYFMTRSKEETMVYIATKKMILDTMQRTR